MVVDAADAVWKLTCARMTALASVHATDGEASTHAVNTTSRSSSPRRVIDGALAQSTRMWTLSSVAKSGPPHDTRPTPGAVVMPRTRAIADSMPASAAYS